MNITALIEYFVHPRLKHSADSMWKAKVLIGSLMLLGIVGTYLLIYTAINDVSQASLLWIPVLLVPIMIILFRRSGSLIFFGNLTTGIFALYMTPMPYYSGGIYSEDLIWLLIAPIMAFTLTTIRSGIFWTAYVFIVQGVYFYLETESSNSYFDQIGHWTPQFYYLSMTGFFFCALMLVAASKFGAKKIIAQLLVQQEQLNRKTRELERKTEQLRLVEKTLRSSNEELEQFAYVVSHDLKAPLRNINSFSRLLEKHLKKKYELDFSSLEFLEFIKTGTVNMNQLIEDIMTYSRAGGNHDNHDVSVKMDEIRLLLENNLRQQLQETSSELTWHNIPEEISMPKVQMLQLLQNLISNAIKYRIKTATPKIKVSVKDDNLFWKISVRDNGSGISEENINKVFDLFIKLPGTDQEGSGIGLATCKKIVNNSGGDIWVESQLGVGSTFHFTIPKMPITLIHKTDTNSGSNSASKIRQPSVLN